VPTLKLGTRGSQLALFQAHAVAGLLRSRAAIDCDITVIKTSGDRLTEAPLSEIGGKRLFVKEIEDALLAGTIDLAVHSSKDMPTIPPHGLTVGAVLAREDARDAIVLPIGGELPKSSGLEDVVRHLGHAPRIGTSSVRRIAQLTRLFPAAQFAPIRGNLGTRLQKLDSGAFDAIVLAAAGLIRLGYESRLSTALPVKACVPAPGQGIIAIEIRNDDAMTSAAVSKITDPLAAMALTAERVVATRLGGGCQMPIGAYAVVSNGELALTTIVLSLDGTRMARADDHGSAAEAILIGTRTVDKLLKQGAADILAEIGEARPTFDSRPLFGRRVLVTRPREQAVELVGRLTLLGADTIEAPLIRIEPPEDPGPLQEAAAAPDAFDWIVFASANAVDAFMKLRLESDGHVRTMKGPRLCAIGPGTAERLTRYGVEIDVLPDEFRSEALVAAIATAGPISGSRVLLPRANIGRDVVADQLRNAGSVVTEVVAYRTILNDTLRPGKSDVHRLLLEGHIDVVTFASPSAARSFVAIYGAEAAADLLKQTVVAVIGPTTAETTRQLGLPVTIQPATYTIAALADAIAEHFAREK